MTWPSEGAVLLAERRCDHLEWDRPALRHGAIDFPLDEPPLRGERPEKLPAASRKDLLRRFSENLPGGASEDRLRRPVEGAQPSPGVGGDQADRHVLDEAVGEGLDPGEGTPRRAVALGEEERDDPRAADEQKEEGHPDRMADVLLMGRR